MAQLEPLGYPYTICENVRLLIERAENAEAEVTRLRGVLERVEERLETIRDNRDPERMTQEAYFGVLEVNRAVADKQPEPPEGQ